MSSKILVIDCETTGVLSYRHAIHQLACLVIIDDVITEQLSLLIRPHELAIIDPAALKAGNVTPEIIAAYPHRTEQYKKFITLLNKYVDPYNPEDKFTLLGFCNSSFDDAFLRNFINFEDGNFGSWFFSNSLDASVLATQYLLPDRAKMPSFKLSRVYQWVTGNVPDESRLHEAGYDVELTWELYKKVRGKTIDDW